MRMALLRVLRRWVFGCLGMRSGLIAVHNGDVVIATALEGVSNFAWEVRGKQVMIIAECEAPDPAPQECSSYDYLGIRADIAERARERCRHPEEMECEGRLEPEASEK